MHGGAQLSVLDQRAAARHPVDHATCGEHLGRGEIALHICNVSTRGCMIDRNLVLSRGERVIVRLPVIGRIEGYCMWTSGDRAGLQFERVIRPADFAAMIEEMGPRAPLQATG